MEEEKLLGKQVGYPQSYCPEILVSVPRCLNREIYGINNPGDLFYGYDSWHAYEASFITRAGLPVVGILKLVYPSTSEFLVESKSLKLYLGSFNMTPQEGSDEFVAIIEKDLGRLLHTEVRGHFYNSVPAIQPFDFPDYTTLEGLPETGQIHFSAYQEHPEFLKENIIREPGEIRVCSHLLKSNCKITRQPDWGSIYIRLKAGHTPAPASLLKYIVSLRNENHFHEEICEMTFKRLTDIFHPEILMVSCLYTRRGGIDICPVRANEKQHLPSGLPQSGILTRPGFRQ